MEGFNDFGSIFYCVLDSGEQFLAPGEVAGHPSARVMRFPRGTPSEIVLTEVKANVGQACAIFFFARGSWNAWATDDHEALREWADQILTAVRPLQFFSSFHASRIVRVVDNSQRESVDLDDYNKVANHFLEISPSASCAIVPDSGLIFVREEYIELLTELLQHFLERIRSGRRSRRILYIGNHGIGKSMGGLVLLFLLLRLGKSVVYHNSRAYSEAFYVFQNGHLHETSGDVIYVTKKFLCDSSVVYIHDGHGLRAADDIKAHAVLITSPDPVAYKDFRKNGVYYFYGDLWSMDELEMAWPSFEGVSRDEFFNRVQLVGCIPRVLLFSPEEFYHHMEHVNNQINRAPESIIEDIGMHDPDKAFSHTVVVLRKGASRDSAIKDFVSKWAEEQVWLRVERSA